MNRTILSIVAGYIGIVAAQAQQQPDPGVNANASAAVVGSSVMLRQSLSRADLAIASSRVSVDQLKGKFGEHFAAGISHGEKWEIVRQYGKSVDKGIDQILVKVSSNGKIDDLMVCEVKWNKSTLSTTPTGKQLSSTSNASHLTAHSNRYDKLGKDWSSGKIAVVPMKSGIKKNQMMGVPMGNKGNATFWREDSKSLWKLDATKSQRPRISEQVRQMSQVCRDAADGSRPYSTKLVQVKFEGSNIVTTVRSGTGGLPRDFKLSDMPIQERIVTPIRHNDSVFQSMAHAWEVELERTQPHLHDKEIKLQAKDLAKKTISTGPFLKQPTLAAQIGRSSAVGSVLATGIDLTAQLLTAGAIDYEQLGVNTVAGTGAGLGYYAGYKTTYTLINKPAGLHLSRKIATSMGLASTSFSANLLGSAVGGSAASAAFSYLLYFNGYMDLETANRSAFAYTTGFIVGTGLAIATTSLVAAYGTAGTGVAISSLSGAAATSATTAALGSAGGVLVSATGVGLIAIGVGAGIMWGFHMHDTAQENERLEFTYKYLHKHYTNALK